MKSWSRQSSYKSRKVSITWILSDVSDRAGKLVADLANATSYRVELELDQNRQVDSTPPPPSDGSPCVASLASRAPMLGTIHLYLPEGNEKLETTTCAWRVGVRGRWLAACYSLV